jgi:hypothetical protein
MESCLLFCLGWPQAVILLISSNFIYLFIFSKCRIPFLLREKLKTPNRAAYLRNVRFWLCPNQQWAVGLWYGTFLLDGASSSSTREYANAHHALLKP